MDKKKRTRELIVFAVIVLALLAGCLLTPSGGESEPIQEKKGRGQGSVKKTKRCCKAAVDHEGRLAFPACRWYK